MDNVNFNLYIRRHLNMSKNYSKSNHLFLIVFALTMFLTSQEAKAYLDPGTGTIIIQGLIAAVVGGAVAIRMYWFKLKSVFAKKSKVKISGDSTEK